MPRILLIGDFHIPTRARRIPSQILEAVKDQSFDLILCTGDLTDQDIARFLARLGKLYIVRGNMDYLRYPREFKVKVEDFIIGLRHGDSIHPRGNVHKLTQLALRMGVDILVSGHTHRSSVHEVTLERGKKILLLNPGSATGVWSGGGFPGNPSFMILEVEGNKIMIRVFELRADRLEESRYTFSK